MRRDNAPHEGLRLPLWMRRWIYGAGLLSLLSGALWLLFHNFMQAEGEFGPVAHPLERTWIVIHGGAALLVAWVFGMVWLAHVHRGLQGDRRLPSGLGVVALALFLILSGWGLYYLGDEGWRAWASTAHWVVGLGAAALLVLHAGAWRRPR